jgi:predicted N-formylglutamate amidohydrolase
MYASLLITCEHAGNEVPDEYADFFIGQQEILMSHRGWDPGAFHVAQFLAEKQNTVLFSHPITRLLIEPNRSLDHPQLFSVFTNVFSEGEKSKLISIFYLPYRKEVENAIGRLKNPVLHLSIHSFTPVLNDIVRAVDIGLLFDPSRSFETGFCNRYLENLKQLLPAMRIEFNEPYLGIDDGFTTYLRKKFCDGEYAGIEIEINQKFMNTPDVAIIQSALSKALSGISN